MPVQARLSWAAAVSRMGWWLGHYINPPASERAFVRHESPLGQKLGARAPGGEVCACGVAMPGIQAAPMSHPCVKQGRGFRAVRDTNKRPHSLLNATAAPWGLPQLCFSSDSLLLCTNIEMAYNSKTWKERKGSVSFPFFSGQAGWLPVLGAASLLPIPTHCSILASRVTLESELRVRAAL